MTTKEKQTVKVSAKIMWCFHNRVNDMADKYTIDFYDLSEAAVEALEEMGISVKFEDPKDVEKENKAAAKKDKDAKPKVARSYYITCKSKNPIRVRDEAQESLDDVAIGNDTEAVVTVGFYDWVNPKKKTETGRSPSARRVVVTELIPYEGSDMDDDDEPVL